MLADYRGSEIHNEILHYDSASFASDRKYPSPITPRSSRRSAEAAAGAAGSMMTG